MLKKIIFYFRLLLSDEWSKYKIYEKYLGISFGKKVRILHFPRFGSEPYLIKIGDNVTITRGVVFLNHDGGVALFRDEYPGLNNYAKIEVGNNVFLGVNSIIMPGVTIGSNVVIGAGSVVTKSIPDNVVAAGVPAKIIKSIEEYKESALDNACIINTTNPVERKKIIIQAAEKYRKNKN